VVDAHLGENALLVLAALVRAIRDFPLFSPLLWIRLRARPPPTTTRVGAEAGVRRCSRFSGDFIEPGDR
jgi:hypothetical protein